MSSMAQFSHADLSHPESDGDYQPMLEGDGEVLSPGRAAWLELRDRMRADKRRRPWIGNGFEDRGSNMEDRGDVTLPIQVAAPAPSESGESLASMGVEIECPDDDDFDPFDDE